MNITIEDYLDRDAVGAEAPTASDPDPKSLGLDLDTIEGAQAWLVNSHNWIDTELFILKWDGLVPSISRKHGKRLRAERTDTGLAWCVVYERKRRRARGASEEEKEGTVPVESDV